MAALGVTSRMQEALRFIAHRYATTRVCPSYAELGEALGVSSKSNISRMVLLLEERGLIERLPNCARSLALTEAGWRASGVAQPAFGDPGVRSLQARIFDLEATVRTLTAENARLRALIGGRRGGEPPSDAVPPVQTQHDQSPLPARGLLT